MGAVTRKAGHVAESAGKGLWKGLKWGVIAGVVVGGVLTAGAVAGAALLVAPLAGTGWAIAAGIGGSLLAGAAGMFTSAKAGFFGATLGTGLGGLYGVFTSKNNPEAELEAQLAKEQGMPPAPGMARMDNMAGKYQSSQGLPANLDELGPADGKTPEQWQELVKQQQAISTQRDR